MKQKLKPKEVIDALIASDGFIIEAAKRLGVHPNTVSNYAKRYPEVQEALENARIEAAEFVYSKLLEKCRDGDVTAIIFAMKLLGKYIGLEDTQKILATTEKAISVFATDKDTALKLLTAEKKFFEKK